MSLTNVDVIWAARILSVDLHKTRSVFSVIQRNFQFKDIWIPHYNYVFNSDDTSLKNYFLNKISSRC